ISDPVPADLTAETTRSSVCEGFGNVWQHSAGPMQSEQGRRRLARKIRRKTSNSLKRRCTPSDFGSGGVMSVLIVEDVSVNRSYLRKILEKEGHDVLEAEHGADALEILAKTPVRCVVTDLSMPVLDGWGLIAQMRSQPACAAIPVVL